MKLLERELYLEALGSRLEAVRRAAGCITLVCGEAGIGKTSLIQEFAARQGAAVRILWGGCEALFTPHPLAPLYDIARQADEELRSIVARASSRELIFNATIDYLARVPSPAILVIEDVHWADEATLDLIKFLGRRLQPIGVMLIITYREDEVGPQHPLRSVIGDLPTRSVHRIVLPPLTETAVVALARDAGRQSAGLHAATGGNPFFVTEALAMAQDTVPATVRDAVIARIARLSPTAREIANLVSVVPGETEQWLLEQAVTVTESAVQECLMAGMVAQSDNCLAFRHELARRAVEESLSPPLRRTLHARILAALQGHRETDALARLVHHADKAADSAAVLRFAPEAAARAASLGAHREAARHFATAVAHAGGLPVEQRAEFLDHASYEYYLTDQMTEAFAARKASLVLWESAGCKLREGDCLRWLSRLAWFSGDKRAADRYAAQAVQTLEPLAPGRELAMAYSNRSQLHMLADEAEAALLWGNKALALAVELGDTEIECHALNNVGTTRLLAQDQTGNADLERSLLLATRGDYQEHAARALTNISSSATRRRDYARANRYLDEGIAYCQKRDLGSWERYMTAVRAEARLAQGDWQHATDDAQAILHHPRVAAVSRIPALTVLARVRARRGDPEAQAPLDEAHQLALATGELQRLGPVAVSQAEVSWLTGAVAESLASVRDCYVLAQRQSDHWMRGELAFWLWRCGHLDEVPKRLAQPFALQIAGDWSAAARAWEALGCPYEQAVALAETQLEADMRGALEIFERLGGAPMARLVRRRLRASGVRGIPRGAQERTKRNPHGLTNRELNVLALLAEGCRNAEIARRLFVAEKTVGHHVSAVLSKLDVRSRGEAAAVANQLGLCRSITKPRPVKR